MPIHRSSLGFRTVPLISRKLRLILSCYTVGWVVFVLTTPNWSVRSRYVSIFFARSKQREWNTWIPHSRIIVQCVRSLSFVARSQVHVSVQFIFVMVLSYRSDSGTTARFVMFAFISQYTLPFHSLSLASSLVLSSSVKLCQLFLSELCDQSRSLFYDVSAVFNS